MNILWLCDEPGWAFDNVSRKLAAKMPQHNHRFGYYKQTLEYPLDGADVIMVHHPEVISWLPEEYRSRVVLRCASRIFRLTVRVLWFCDERGWAYERRAKMVMQNLPLWEHHLAYYFDYKTDAERSRMLAQYDLVICMCNAYAALVPDKRRAIVCMGGFRLLKMIGLEEGATSAGNDKPIINRERAQLVLGDSFSKPVWGDAIPL